MILVTGSAGHLGEAILRLCQAQGIAARGLDIKASDFTDVVGSITDQDTVRQAMDGVDVVLHCATLHKPHVATHTRQQFIDVNVTGTLTLLEAAKHAEVKGFVYTSTTSTFGRALTPTPGEPAAWITPDVVPVPKNIYGVTKCAAEDLVELFATKFDLPGMVLKAARFFPEADDDPQRRAAYPGDNAKVLELLHRRIDVADCAEAQLAAALRVASQPFARHILSATTPFTKSDAKALVKDAKALIIEKFPKSEAIFAKNGWNWPKSIERVYDNSSARKALEWEPKHNFQTALDALEQGQLPFSDLHDQVGIKGYHDQEFTDGPYPVG